MRIPPMPFKVLVLAPFQAEGETPWPHGPVRVEKANLDQVLAEMDLSLQVVLPRSLCPSGRLSLGFKRLRDFHPDAIIKNTPFLQNLLDARNFADEAGTQGLSNEEIGRRLAQWPDLPPIDFEISPPRPKPAPSTSVDDILKLVALPVERVETPRKTDSFTAQINSVFRNILSQIFSDEGFLKLESVWRGLRFFMSQSGSDGEVSVSIAPVLPESLEDTLGKLLAGPGLDFPSLVMVDLSFDSSTSSIALLEKIGLFAETLLGLALAWITPRLFHVDGWEDLKGLAYLPHHLEQQAFAKWQSLRKSSAAKWLAVACNRFLLRYAYGPDNKVSVVDFQEDSGLWASPVWALGGLICQSVIKSGWPTRFTNWQEVRLEDMPLNRLGRDEVFATEVSFSEERIDQLIKSGIVPLVSPPNRDIVFVPAETTIAGNSLRYQLLLARIVELFLWCKDSFTEELEPGNIERGLKRAFALYWERTGQPGPEDLEISVWKPDPQEPGVVRLALVPARQILASREKVELELKW